MSTPKKLVASAAMLAAVGAFVSFGVFSTWSNTQSNSSSLTAGSLSLTRNTPSSLISALTGLIPGDIVTRCASVTKNGDVASTVTMTPHVTSSLSGLAGTIQASIESGSALTDSDGGCTGFVSTGYLLSTTDVSSFSGAKTLADLDSQAVNYTSSGWANGATKYYRVKLALPTSASSSLQGAVGTFTIDWVVSQPSGDTGR